MLPLDAIGVTASGNRAAIVPFTLIGKLNKALILFGQIDNVVNVRGNMITGFDPELIVGRVSSWRVKLTVLPHHESFPPRISEILITLGRVITRREHPAHPTPLR
jgi:hypothetical protein